MQYSYHFTAIPPSWSSLPSLPLLDSATLVLEVRVALGLGSDGLLHSVGVVVVELPVLLSGHGNLLHGFWLEGGLLKHISNSIRKLNKLKQINNIYM